MSIIRTNRLELIPAPIEFIELLVANEYGRAGDLLKVLVSVGWPADGDARAGLSVHLKALQSNSDLNGDGHADVVLGNQQAPGAVLINDGTGRRFTLVRLGDKQGTVYGLAIGDVNGDGSPDIVAARSDAPSMLYLNSLVMKTGPRSTLTPADAIEIWR